MALKILVFGQLTEITQTSELEWETVEQVGALRQQLLQRFPEMAHISVAIAVNQTLADDQTAIPANGEIALLPPFSGG
jgi:molybdopterin converting factor small subunit